jgi:hypothetical protein
MRCFNMNKKPYMNLLIVALVTIVFVVAFSGCSATPKVADNVNNTIAPVNEVTEPTTEVTEPITEIINNPDTEVVEEETTTPITDVPTETSSETNTSSNTSAETNTSTGACVDTDGGIDYLVKGTITITNDDGSIRSYTDYCRHGSSEGQVFEYYCANNAVASENYECPKECNNNGACYP